jgi:hypothetical protein
MTYIQLVNNVLIRLRERTVDTTTQSEYSSLIGILINDAKEEVENAWNWSACRTTLQGSTVAGIFNMELQSAESRFTIIDAWDATSNRKLKPKSVEDFNELYLSTDTPEEGSPLYYCFNGVSEDGDTLVDFYPIPDAVYTILFNATVRSVDLVDDSDYLLVPDKPVALLAYAMAIEERGEDGGASSTNAFFKAQRSLSDQIAHDVSKHPEEIVWYEV